VTVFFFESCILFSFYFVCPTQVNGDSTFDCGRRLQTVSTVCQLQQLLMRKYSAAMEVSYVLAIACTIIM